MISLLDAAEMRANIRESRGHSCTRVREVKVSKFQIPYIEYIQQSQHWRQNNSGYLSVDSSKLARAMFVTGRAHGDEFPDDESYGRWEYRHRYGFVRAYSQGHPVQNRPLHQLGVTPLAESLEPTEKGYTSFTFGQALTGVYCHDILKIDRLLHIDTYGKDNGINLDGSGRKPDFFGYDGANTLVIAESKGRTTDLLSLIKTVGRDATKQLDAVTSIEVLPVIAITTGEDRTTTIGRILRSLPRRYRLRMISTVAAISPKSRSITLHIFHHLQTVRAHYPVAVALDAVDYYATRDRDVDYDLLSLRMDRHVFDYCLRFVRLLEIQEDGVTSEVDDLPIDDLRTVHFIGIGVTVGLLADIESAARERLAVLRDGEIINEELRGFSNEIRGILNSANLGAEGMFSDGSFFRTNWPAPVELE